MNLSVGKIHSWRHCYYSEALVSIEETLQQKYKGLIFTEPTYTNGLRIEINNPENVGPQKAVFEINFGYKAISSSENVDKNPYSTIYFGFTTSSAKPSLAKTNFDRHLKADEVISLFEDFLEKSYEELGGKKLISWFETKIEPIPVAKDIHTEPEVQLVAS